MSSNDANDYSTQDERSDTETPSKSGAEQPVKRTKRKKASRACFHCQKAHLTCDDCKLLDNLIAQAEHELTYSSSMSALRQAGSRRHLSGRHTKEGQIPARCRQ